MKISKKSEGFGWGSLNEGSGGGAGGEGKDTVARESIATLNDRVNDVEDIAQEVEESVSNIEESIANVEQAIENVENTIIQIETETHEHENKDVLDDITEEKVDEWDNKAEKSEIPTKVSDLENDLDLVDKEYVDNQLENVDLTDYYTKEEIDDKLENVDVDLDDYYTKGEVDQKLADIAGGGSINLDGYAEKSYVNEQIANLATKEELEDKVDKVEGHSLISDDEIARLANVDNYDDTEVKESIEGIKEEIGIQADVDNGIDATGLYKYVDDKVGNVDFSELQPKEDENLTTDDKTIVGALNELDMKSIEFVDFDGDLNADMEFDILNRLSECEENKVDKVNGKSLIADTEIARLANVDNYDDTEIKELINNVDKKAGKIFMGNDGITELNNRGANITLVNGEDNTLKIVEALKFGETFRGWYGNETSSSRWGIDPSLYGDTITDIQIFKHTALFASIEATTRYGVKLSRYFNSTLYPWTRADSSNTLVTDTQTFTIDITKNNANWYGFIKLGYFYGSYGEVTINTTSSTGNVTYSVEGDNAIESITYTYDSENPAHITIGVNLKGAVYGIQTLEVPKEFANLNSFTKNAFTGAKTAIDKTTSGNYGNFSTTEQVVGTWIDGKTLYRRVMQYTYTMDVDTKTNFQVGTISGFTQLVSIKGNVKHDGKFYPVPNPFACEITAWVDTSGVVTVNGSPLATGDVVYLIIEYTK